MLLRPVFTYIRVLTYIQFCWKAATCLSLASIQNHLGLTYREPLSGGYCIKTQPLQLRGGGRNQQPYEIIDCFWSKRSTVNLHCRLIFEAAASRTSPSDAPHPALNHFSINISQSCHHRAVLAHLAAVADCYSTAAYLGNKCTTSLTWACVGVGWCKAKYRWLTWKINKCDQQPCSKEKWCDVYYQQTNNVFHTIIMGHHQHILGAVLVVSICPFKFSSMRVPAMASIRWCRANSYSRSSPHLCEWTTNRYSQLL